MCGHFARAQTTSGKCSQIHGLDAMVHAPIAFLSPCVHLGFIQSAAVVREHVTTGPRGANRLRSTASFTESARDAPRLGSLAFRAASALVPVAVFAAIVVAFAHGGRVAVGVSHSAVGRSSADAVDPSVQLVIPSPVDDAPPPSPAPTSSVPSTLATMPPTTAAAVPTTSGAPVASGSSGPRSRQALAPPSTANERVPGVTDPSWIATAVVSSVPLYPSPNAPAPAHILANPNYLGATLVLLVAGYQPGWVEAYVPIRPNGSVTWVPQNDVSLSLVDEHVVIDLATRHLTLYANNAAVFDSPVAPGAPSSPTPTGLFYVTYVVEITDPGDAYGPDALALSAFSNTYFTFDGGPGQIAIHGTNQPWAIGSYASHGCVRLPNAAIAALATLVPPGTPVVIEPD
jgi:hypothetical protein